MLKGAEDSERITEFYEYIQDGGAKEAFALLIGTFACLRTFSCGVKPQGNVRSIGLEISGECWFAIMVTQKSLTFQWRPPITRTQRYDQDQLRAQFPSSFTSTSQDGHWAVKIRSIEEALLLLLILDLT